MDASRGGVEPDDTAVSIPGEFGSVTIKGRHPPSFYVKMSPENVTGYLCSRKHRTGPCVTTTPHPCNDAVQPKTSPTLPKASNHNPPFKAPKVIRTPLVPSSSSSSTNTPPNSQHYVSEEGRHNAVMVRHSNPRYVRSRRSNFHRRNWNCLSNCLVSYSSSRGDQYRYSRYSPRKTNPPKLKLFHAGR